MQTELNMNEKYQYQIIRTKQNIEGIGESESYGIAWDFADENMMIPDISTDFEFVSVLVMLLNRNDVSPIHLQDVIEDFISDFDGMKY